MKPTRFAGALIAVLLLTSCAAHTVRIADLKDRPGHYEARTIKVGEKNGTLAEVLDGLQEGEVVVKEGAFTLKSELLKPKD